MGSIRVILAEDHPRMAEALQSILQAEFELVATVRDGWALVNAAKELKPDVIVADVSMPQLSGINAARAITAAGVTAKIIFLTMHADALLVTEAFRAGASAYLLKDAAANELPVAIRQVVKGNRYVTSLLGDDTALVPPESHGNPRKH